jgi:hypothetical protein
MVLVGYVLVLGMPILILSPLCHNFIKIRKGEEEEYCALKEAKVNKVFVHKRCVATSWG